MPWTPSKEDVIAGNGESVLDRGINTPCPALCCSLPLSLSEINLTTLAVPLSHKVIHELPHYPTIRCRHHSKWRTPAVTAATTIPSSRPASWVAMPSTSRASERWVFIASVKPNARHIVLTWLLQAAVGSISGSKAWTDSGVHDKEAGLAAMKKAGEQRDPNQGYGRAEEWAGKLTGCEGMQKEGFESAHQRKD